MQHRVGSKIFTQVTVKRRERMCRGKTAFKQQAHRITFITESRLHGDQQMTELVTHHKDGFAVGQIFARGWPPMGFDVSQIALTPHMVFRRNQGVDIRVGAVLHTVAFQNAVLQRFTGFGHVDGIALLLHGLHGVEERLEHRQIGSGARVARVGREIENHHGHAALSAFTAAQRYQTSHPHGKHGGALGAGEHVFLVMLFGEGTALLTTGAGHAVSARATAVDHGNH